MRVLLFDGSANPDGTIATLLQRVGEALVAEGVAIEQVRLERNRATGCTVCGACGHSRDLNCARPPADGLRRCARRLLAADGVVLGSPAYAAGVSPATQRLMTYLGQRPAGREHPLACKVAAAVVDARNARAPHTLAVLTQWLRANDMIVVGPSGRVDGEPGAVDGDAGAAMARLGRAMALMLKRLGA